MAKKPKKAPKSAKSAKPRKPAKVNPQTRRTVEIDERLSPSGIPIAAFYGPAKTSPDYAKKLGDPGEFPFTRGVQPTMYRGRLWTMRQIAGFGTAEDTNQRFKYLIAQGQTGLSTDFDMPTLMGYDSDHPMSEGEVGREGVAIDTMADMELLYDGIDLAQYRSVVIWCAEFSVLISPADLAAR